VVFPVIVDGFGVKDVSLSYNDVSTLSIFILKKSQYILFFVK